MGQVVASDVCACFKLIYIAQQSIDIPLIPQLK